MSSQPTEVHGITITEEKSASSGQEHFPCVKGTKKAESSMDSWQEMTRQKDMNHKVAPCGPAIHRVNYCDKTLHWRTPSEKVDDTDVPYGAAPTNGTGGFGP